MDYYERQQINDYYKIQRKKGNYLVNIRDIREYISEFIKGIDPFIEEGYFLNAEAHICKFIGSLVKFTFSKIKERTKFDESSDLKKLLWLIQYERINDIKKVLEEKQIRIYDENVLYLYKSNHPKDWTRTKALDDAKSELELICKHLPNRS